jgi:hypothetical protein
VWTIIGGVAGVVAAGAAVWFSVASVRIAQRQEAAERQRLNREVFGQFAVGSDYTVGTTTVQAPPADQVRPQGDARPTDQVRPQGDAPLTDQVPPPDQVRPQGQAPPADQVPPPDQVLPPVRVPPAEELLSSRDSRYDQLLVNDYALGLTQARRAFNASMSFSILGGIVLILGVSLAIFRAATGGQVVGAAITSAAGVLTSGLSQLFRGQSTKALKHLETQAVELRTDVRARTNSASALRLLEEVTDDHLRSRLQAALILEFTGATLPDVDTPSQPQLGNLDGRVRSNEVAELSTPSSS